MPKPLPPKILAIRENARKKIEAKQREEAEVTSSSARTELVKKVAEVYESKQDLVITADGKALAVFTVNLPQGTAPLQIKTTDAAQGWSDLLNLIAIANARYVFVLKPLPGKTESRKVFLVRGTYRNRFSEAWGKHRQKFSEKQSQKNDLDKADAIFEKIEIIEGAVKALGKQVATEFAFRNRDGDLLKTPESGVVPYRNASDFPNPHCGD